MADIARLGFSANTSDLKDAKVALEQLRPAAAAAASGVDKFNRAAAGVTVNSKGAATGIKSFEAAALGASGSTDRLSKTALASGTAMGTVQRAAVGASAGIGNLYTAVARVNPILGQADAHVQAYKASLLALPAAANTASSSLNRLGAAANDNINRLQSTPGNITAQFQDIAVTAAAGMSPMLIALQQGTQLSSAMSGGIGNLLAGFAQLFSATTLLTIVLVGLIAYGLQMVDWMGLAKTLLLFLADAMERFAEVAAYAGVVLAIAFAPKILTMVGALTVAIGKGLVAALVSATGAMIAFALANPFGALIIVIGLVVAAMWALDDTMGGVFGNTIGYAKTAANVILGAFVWAFNSIVTIWKDLPAILGDLAIQAANRTKSALNGLFTVRNTDTGETWTPLSNKPIANPYAGRAAKAGRSIVADAGAQRNIDHVGNIAGGIRNLGGKLRGFANGLGGGADKDKNKEARDAMTEAERLAKAYADIVQAANARITALGVESKALDMSNNAAHLYRIEQELIAQAVDKGIKLTAEQTAELKGLAATISRGELNVAFKQMLANIREQQQGLTDAGEQIGKYGLELEYTKQRQLLINDAVKRGIIDLNNMTDAMRLQVAMLENRAAALAAQGEDNRRKEFMAEALKTHNDEIYALQRERGEIGLTGAALEAYRIETELLAAAKQKNLQLTPAEIEQLRQLAQETGVLTEAIRKQREETEFYRDTYRGFFSDMVNGLREGKSMWEAFGDAVMNVVNKIIDRLLDTALDGLFNNKDGSPGGLLASIGKLFIKKSADGNAFGSGELERFAKGGAFTNGLYDSPTLFKFAKGAAMGMMGEAGPEAVMPLKRGPDGSLGVQMHGGAQAVHVSIGVEDDRFNAYVDERADGRVATHAPTIARAGSDVAHGRLAFNNNRRLSS